MAKISVSATCRRNAKGFFEEIVIVVIAGRELVYRCHSPEHARAEAEVISKELGIWKIPNTSTD